MPPSPPSGARAGVRGIAIQEVMALTLSLSQRDRGLFHTLSPLRPTGDAEAAGCAGRVDPLGLLMIPEPRPLIPGPHSGTRNDSALHPAEPGGPSSSDLCPPATGVGRPFRHGAPRPWLLGAGGQRLSRTLPLVVLQQGGPPCRLPLQVTLDEPRQLPTRLGCPADAVGLRAQRRGGRLLEDEGVRGLGRDGRREDGGREQQSDGLWPGGESRHSERQRHNPDDG